MCAYGRDRHILSSQFGIRYEKSVVTNVGNTSLRGAAYRVPVPSVIYIMLQSFVGTMKTGMMFTTQRNLEHE